MEGCSLGCAAIHQQYVMGHWEIKSRFLDFRLKKANDKKEKGGLVLWSAGLENP
jgi:hypothetical protein